MIKIFLTVRNRLEITKKCIKAIKKHTTLPHHIYVYNNNTNHLIDEHFQYFCDLYKKNVISQVTFTKPESTFNAFSKASTCNFFGRQHEEDPKKDSYFFLVMIDNDIIVAPDWDMKLKQAWKFVGKNNMPNVKIIGQFPGGMRNKDGNVYEIGTMKAKLGQLGGSGLWSVRNNFFKEVGVLPLNQLVGQDKRHDQLYWGLLSKASSGKPYIMGLMETLAYHCGSQVGSVCNVLTRNRNNPKKEDLIRFDDVEAKLRGMTFEEFYTSIKDNNDLCRW